MEAIEDFTNLLVGKSKRIFSRFLSILLSAILYYSNDISFVDTTTTNSNNTLNINLTATPTLPIVMHRYIQNFHILCFH